ncbi:hypothetical protein VULLAG_LOCUS21274 [Vulpes lagopus]
MPPRARRPPAGRASRAPSAQAPAGGSERAPAWSAGGARRRPRGPTAGRTRPVALRLLSSERPSVSALRKVCMNCWLLCQASWGHMWTARKT